MRDAGFRTCVSRGTDKEPWVHLIVEHLRVILAR